MEPFSSDVLWVLILGFIVGFFLAFGVGANDVANSFGTSVGSKALSLRQACILATIFEVLGSVLMGYRVSDTVRKGIFDTEMYSEFEKELMLGFLAALIGSAIWNIVATFFRWPISGTHSIIGAVVGFSLVARGFMGIKWTMLGQIVASWFLSPVLSGFISSALFLVLKKLVLTKDDAIERGYLSLPFFWGITVFINLFSVVHNGPKYLGFQSIPVWGVLILAAGIGFIVSICVWYILVPYLQQAIASMGDSENSENQIGAEEIPSKISYPDVENPAFNGNGHEIQMQDVGNGISKSTIVPVATSAEISKIEKEFTCSAVPYDTPETGKVFSSLQVLTAIFAAFAHGANDVSNAIGPVIAIWLIYQDGNVAQRAESPFWIMLYGGVGISIGLWVWGKKVIKTMGEDLTKITPSSGFCIELGAAATVLMASKIGLPISTTHCKVGSIVFVGWTRSRAAVDWKLFRSIILAWVLTLPVSAGLSAAAMAILKSIG
ncbi:sodium-dependent phosphate transporter 1-A isoform X2 [Parasteatoda tepidariorum]|nr:sodium-dependent phosphate transporter 1 isoform X2 [Parasteatoda tepidariorum]XP_015930362.1 sodium-dependent phosphate transporter 1 isoform X2 [Parasteatoda tepidariorum]XP_015930370.1 sodium-dependent phosphate transporter 1 isoform X2 [Parasteatoda tepidariorum]XP_042900296.1 sodium-dependent phosphate transporter 1 isoform X2 [Parasteatoda tepidariorum]